jgi:hypothetical protein
VFFCNRSTSAVCNHTVKDVCNHLYFHQVVTTSSKDQSSHIKLFTSFLQSQSHSYKGAITLRQDLQSTTFWFATVFFFNRSTSVVANTLQRMLQSPVFWPGCNPSSKDHPSCNLTVSWHRAFFWNWCFFTRVFLQLFFFAKSLL